MAASIVYDFRSPRPGLNTLQCRRLEGNPHGAQEYLNLGKFENRPPGPTIYFPISTMAGEVAGSSRPFFHLSPLEDHGQGISVCGVTLTASAEQFENIIRAIWSLDWILVDDLGP